MSNPSVICACVCALCSHTCAGEWASSGCVDLVSRRNSFTPFLALPTWEQQPMRVQGSEREEQDRGEGGVEPGNRQHEAMCQQKSSK